VLQLNNHPNLKIIFPRVFERAILIRLSGEMSNEETQGKVISKKLPGAKTKIFSLSYVL